MRKLSFAKPSPMAIGLIVVLGLLFFQLTAWQKPFVGWVLFILYITLTGSVWEDVLQRMYRIKKDRFTTRLLGAFAAWVLLTSIAAMWVVWYMLTPLFLWYSYVLAAIVPFLLRSLRRGKGRKDAHALSLSGKWIVFRRTSLLIPAFFILAGILLVVFIKSGSDSVLLSPWQGLSPYVLPLFFLLTLTLAILLLSRCKMKPLIFLVILHSLLIHSYIGFAHTQPWGGDVWRHIAAESQLVAGDAIPPVLIGQEAKWTTVAGFAVPEAAIIPHKYIYGHFWGSATIVSQTTGLDLVVFNKWYIPILWGLLMPVLLFYLGATLFGSSRLGLWLAFLATLPYSFQALGAISLPNSLGLLYFIFALMLWLRYLKYRVPQQAHLVFGLGFLFLFGYTLYAILLLWIISISLIFLAIRRTKRTMVALAGSTSLYVLSFFLIPLVDVVTGRTYTPNVIDWLANAKRMIGELSGWYMASAIRPHDIASGNILFNHTPDVAFVPNLFSDWRWLLIVLMIVAWCGFLFMLVRFLRAPSIMRRVIGALMLLVAGGYGVGWYALGGERLFTRRLDGIFALLLMLGALYFINRMVALIHARYAPSAGITRAGAALGVFFFAWIATTTYASGIDLRVVSTDEYETAERIWEVVQHDEAQCVIANSWTLLVVEALSAGQLVGGGFPIDETFRQAELHVLSLEMHNEPRETVISLAKVVTEADRCLFATEAGIFDESKVVSTTAMYASEPERRGNQLLFIPLE